MLSLNLNKAPETPLEEEVAPEEEPTERKTSTSF
jgi:hypothetical protein